jgi:allantoinase
MAAPSSSGEWALLSQHVVTPGREGAAAVLVRGETIVGVVPPDQVPRSCPVVDVAERVVLPGLIDTHIHINEPGRTEWEGFETATRAAAAGGITTLVDMPLNSSPVTTSPAALTIKQAAAQGKLWVDCGFYGGVVPGNADHIEPLLSAGVLGLKAFLCSSGIDEFPSASERDLRAVMPTIARHRRPLLVHAELVGPRPLQPIEGGRRRYASFLATRPREWEHEAIRLMIDLCRELRCHVHVVHLSSADALPMIAQARAEGLPLTVETCPHYLTFAAEEIPDGETRYKCMPPIREAENRERLWEALSAGLIDTIGSDHSPAPPEIKRFDTGDFLDAWGGISSVQLVLPVIWTEARQRGFSMVDLVRWMSRNPAALVGLDDRKGAIAPGFDADLVVFDPDASFTVEPSSLFFRHKATPYEGRHLSGRVEQTFVRGQKVFEGGRHVGGPVGRQIVRSRHKSDMEYVQAH